MSVSIQKDSLNNAFGKSNSKTDLKLVYNFMLIIFVIFSNSFQFQDLNFEVSEESLKLEVVFFLAQCKDKDNSNGIINDLHF